LIHAVPKGKKQRNILLKGIAKVGDLFKRVHEDPVKVGRLEKAGGQIVRKEG
jgi:hypothetical protein